MINCLIIAKNYGKEKILNKSLIDRFIDKNKNIDNFYVMIDKTVLINYKENIVYNVNYIYENEIEDLHKYIGINDRLVVIYDDIYLEDGLPVDMLKSQINYRVKDKLFCLNMIDVINKSFKNIKEYKGIDFYCIDNDLDFYILSKEIIKGRNLDLIEKGVYILDIDSVFIDEDCIIGEGSIIYPNSIIECGSKIGKNCKISGRLKNVSIKNRVEIENSFVSDSIICDDVHIGPYSFIHHDCMINDNSYVGSYVEMKKSIMGNNVKVKHQSVLLDSFIGNNVNIGAGVITANYDGTMKHITRINDNAFIGCNSVLIAPLSIGKRAFVAADTTITRDVKDDEFVISRIEQINKKRRRNNL